MPPDGENFTVSILGHIHNHPYRDDALVNRSFSPDDKSLFTFGNVMYLLNSGGELRYYRYYTQQTITIATGFKGDASKPTILPNAWSGSQNLAPINFYDAIKKNVRK